MFKIILMLYQDENGQDLVEYVLILLLVVILAITFLAVLGEKTSNIFNDITYELP